MARTVGRDIHGEGEALFLAALPEIELVVRRVASRQRLGASDAEDFASEIKLALIENHYEALARFEGRSSLRAYLLTIVQRRFIDYRRRQWGKWRPSVQARRLGPVAQRLEELLYRERLPLAEAVEALSRNHGASESADDLVALAQQLPVRTRRTLESLDDPERSEPGAMDSVDPLEHLREHEMAERCQAALTRAVLALPPDDRVMLRLHFEGGVSVADIARARQADQRKLYARLDAIKRNLRLAIEEQGVAWEDVRPWIESGRCHLRFPAEPPPENPTGVPSSQEGRR